MLNYSQKLKNHLETNCPFKEGAKLFAAAMAAEEKSWIALEVITKRSKAKDLIQKYDLKTSIYRKKYFFLGPGLATTRIFF